MDIKGMQYDFKQKLNKIDSQQYRNLRIPEIDWKINEAYDIYVKSIAEPRSRNHLGFEGIQRSIDDLRTIVENDVEIPTSLIPGTNNYLAVIPEEYQHYVSAKIKMSKEGCGSRVGRALQKQHDDRHEESEFDKSSFEWKEVNIRFYTDGIKIFTDGTFTVESICLDFIRKHPYIHNAEDYIGGTYNLPDGTVLTGTQSCELPEHTHREIVDLAVLIATGDLQIPDYQIKQAKININKTI